MKDQASGHKKEGNGARMGLSRWGGIWRGVCPPGLGILCSWRMVILGAGRKATWSEIKIYHKANDENIFFFWPRPQHAEFPRPGSNWSGSSDNVRSLTIRAPGSSEAIFKMLMYIMNLKRGAVGVRHFLNLTSMKYLWNILQDWCSTKTTLINSTESSWNGFTMRSCCAALRAMSTQQWEEKVCTRVCVTWSPCCTAEKILKNNFKKFHWKAMRAVEDF